MNKTPEPKDFHNSDLRQAALSILGFSETDWDGLDRKRWEWAQVVLAASTHGMLNKDKTAIGIGSGHEFPLYVLADKMRCCVATDLYGKSAFAKLEASATMMRDPAQFFPRPFLRSGLLVATMDACDLNFGDESFDFAFSCSSIEHFGPLEKVAQSVREAYRVLRPGGIYALAVDYVFHLEDPKPRRKRKHCLGELLTADEVKEAIVNSAGFVLDEPISFEVDRSLITNLYHIETSKSDSGSYLPHLWLEWKGSLATSLFMTLRKPG